MTGKRQMFQQSGKFQIRRSTEKPKFYESSTCRVIISLVANSLLLTTGLTFCVINLDAYAFGLYLVLIATVGFILTMAFCIMSPDARSEDSVAKKMWSRMTVKSSTRRRNTIKKPRITASPIPEEVEDGHGYENPLDGEVIIAGGKRLSFLNPVDGISAALSNQRRLTLVKHSDSSSSSSESDVTSTSSKASNDRNQPMLTVLPNLHSISIS